MRFFPGGLAGATDVLTNPDFGRMMPPSPAQMLAAGLRWLCNAPSQSNTSWHGILERWWPEVRPPLRDPGEQGQRIVNVHVTLFQWRCLVQFQKLMNQT